MKTILILFCAATLLATSGCFFWGGRGDRGERGHSERGDHGGEHGEDHGGEHHDDHH